MTDEEQDKAIRTGRIPDLTARSKAVGVDARNEIDIRRKVATIDAQRQDIEAVGGGRRRVGAAREDFEKAQSPFLGAADDLLKKLPFINVFSEMASDMKAMRGNTRPKIPVNDPR